MRALRIALTKGRLEKDTVALFEKCGFECNSIKEKGRKLILPVKDGKIELVLAKAADVITYVENGVCDLGVVGKDTIMENGSHFFEILDLGFGKCRFAVANKKGVDFYQGFRSKTVATKYPNVTREFFESKAMDVRVIKIEGSVELAPLLELSDAIVDIVETGSTLKENGLEVKETIANISARLIANEASLKLRKNEIEELANSLLNEIKKS
ncbi:MAG: ATP phosphoribosyltransferase [Clostridia bacterium]